MYDHTTETIPLRNISLCGYFQSWKYFSDVQEELRTHLDFKEEYLNRARTFLAGNAPTPRNVDAELVRVVIHVRRGDHVTPKRIEEGWVFPEPSYFSRAMKFFKKCFTKVQFVVISDDIDWCKRNIRGDNVIYSTGNEPVVDWAIASLCDHAIITFGTFGIWAAWFADGITITPRCFPAPNSELLRRFNRTEYFRPEWLSM